VGPASLLHIRDLVIRAYASIRQVRVELARRIKPTCDNVEPKCILVWVLAIRSSFFASHGLVNVHAIVVGLEAAMFFGEEIAACFISQCED
jgi:hypothetical protein